MMQTEQELNQKWIESMGRSKHALDIAMLALENGDREWAQQIIRDRDASCAELKGMFLETTKPYAMRLPGLAVALRWAPAAAAVIALGFGLNDFLSAGDYWEHIAVAAAMAAKPIANLIS